MAQNAAAVPIESAREVVKIAKGLPTSDGAGVKLVRLIGTPDLADLDPFLMLDAFGSAEPEAYIAGFPDHPHRGFETVTYMLAGRLRHRDNKGHSGLLEAGSVQWMTAGRGIVHSEMPEQERGLMAGFQLWINLPAKEKMTEPRYQDIAPGRIPIVTAPGGVSVKVIAGSFAGTAGPVAPAATAPLFIDVMLPQGTTFATTLPPAHNAFAYVYEGEVEIGPQARAKVLSPGRLGVLGPGEGFAARSAGPVARLLLVAGRPLNEPVAKYGPFVMNTEAELHQAFADYRAGRL